MSQIEEDGLNGRIGHLNQRMLEAHLKSGKRATNITLRVQWRSITPLHILEVRILLGWKCTVWMSMRYTSVFDINSPTDTQMSC